jgi:CRP-like cAMP-binding protein
MFGEMAVLEKFPRTATAIALGEVKAIELDKQNFEILMMGNSALAFKLLRMLSKRIFESKRRFMILTLPDPQSKVADVFLMLDGMLPNIDKSSESREFRITTEEIARWAGISVSQTKETLNFFAAQHRLYIFPGRIIVSNINDFARFVNSKRTPV